MRLPLIALAALLLCAGPASPARLEPASNPVKASALSPIASLIAKRDVTVVCYEHDAAGDPLAIDAWGYVYVGGDTEHMSQEVCDGAYAVFTHDASVPKWKQALGAIVLAHESNHLRWDVKEPSNEGRTECRAVKRFTQTVLDLGGSQELADDLLPFALAIHFRIARLVPEYDWKPCQIPWPYWESD